MYNSELSNSIHLVLFFFFCADFTFDVSAIPTEVTNVEDPSDPSPVLHPPPRRSLMCAGNLSTIMEESGSYKSSGSSRYNIPSIQHTPCTLHTLTCTLHAHTLGTQVPPASTLVQLRWTLSLLKTLLTPSFPTASTLC